MWSVRTLHNQVTGKFQKMFIRSTLNKVVSIEIDKIS
jgi:hypothetical protein